MISAVFNDICCAIYGGLAPGASREHVFRLGARRELLILKGGNSNVRGIYRGSPGKFDSRTLSRETLSRWTGRIADVHLDVEIKQHSMLRALLSFVTI